MRVKISFNPINREAYANHGDTLLTAMRNAGIRIESLCGGKGLCGKCKVILEKGKIKKKSATSDKFLSDEELKTGYYLACMVRLLGDCVFTIPTESRIENPKILLSAKLQIEDLNPSTKKYILGSSPFTDSPILIPQRKITLKKYSGILPRADDEVYGKLQILDDSKQITATVSRTNNFPEIIDVEPGDNRNANYGLAVDIGTTTIVGLLVDLSSGKIVGQGSTMNLQITYGEELVTRISFSRTNEGLYKLQQAVVSSINEVINKAAEEANLDVKDVTDICAGGNTVMNHIFSGIKPDYLDEANVQVPRAPIIRKAKNIGIHTNPEAYVYCLPNVSRFLGGDAIGDVLSANMHNSQEIGLVVDLGTNGEIIFGNKEWLFSCSCASGPAFEGEGVRHGMRGALGGIDHVKINPETLESEISVIGNVKPKGICGSGIIDIVAEFFTLGIVDFVGKFVSDSSAFVERGSGD